MDNAGKPINAAGAQGGRRRHHRRPAGQHLEHHRRAAGERDRDPRAHDEVLRVRQVVRLRQRPDHGRSGRPVTRRARRTCCSRSRTRSTASSTRSATTAATASTARAADRGQRLAAPGHGSSASATCSRRSNVDFVVAAAHEPVPDRRGLPGAEGVQPRSGERQQAADDDGGHASKVFDSPMINGVQHHDRVLEPAREASLGGLATGDRATSPPRQPQEPRNVGPVQARAAENGLTRDLGKGAGRRQDHPGLRRRAEQESADPAARRTAS